MIGRVYPRAASLLGEAWGAVGHLRQLWNERVDNSPCEVTITTDGDGSGRITVFPTWTEDDRDAMTREFRTCITSLWGCLDSLIVDTVEMLAVLERRQRKEQERFFPIADSEDGFIAHLDESCIDGVLPAHGQIIGDCQPFRDVPDHPVPARLRASLRNLLRWEALLSEGSSVEAWVTPVQPTVEAEAPNEVVEFVKEEPGPLGREFVVARYRTTRPGQGGVIGQPGSYVDLSITGDAPPASSGDTMERRLAAAVAAVARIAALFAQVTEQVPGARAIPVTAQGETPTAPWTPASLSSRMWSDNELRRLAEHSDIGVGVVQNAHDLTLLVTTENGVYERVVPAPSALNPFVERGYAAEDAIHNAAATWGLPDFVLLPSAEHRGSRNREISDGLIVTGRRGVVLQVKSRNATPADEDKERGWVEKKVAEAARQVAGTVRRLLQDPVTMVNGRGRTLVIDGRKVTWAGVVVIDHPSPPIRHQVSLSGRTPVVTLLRRDWEFLFHQLRSTTAVVDYLHRVEGSCPLGSEPERYFELAAADAAATPIPSTARGPGEHHSVPRLPAAPAGSDDDDAHGMVRIMCEDVATAPHDGDEVDRVLLLASIDSLPIGYRTELGQLLIEGLSEVRQAAAGDTMWKFRTFRAELGQPQLGFGVCSRFDEAMQEAFRSWVFLRHHERAETPKHLVDSTSIGILLSPRRDGLREWDTTVFAVKGDPGLAEEQLKSWRRVWNVAPDGAA